MANLYLFDIDGTLVNINNLHKEAYKLSYKALGLDVPYKLIEEASGKSELESQKYIRSKLGLSNDETELSGFIERLTLLQNMNLRRMISFKGVRPLPGVTETLEYLIEHNHVLGIVTGNLYENAKLILKAAGLRKYFSIISADDGTLTREEIVKKAMDNAEAHDKVYVIGDTVHDIKAGKANNAITVGVGPESFLGNPDIKLESLIGWKG